jgi:hypothetical protein
MYVSRNEEQREEGEKKDGHDGMRNGFGLRIECPP